MSTTRAPKTTSAPRAQTIRAKSSRASKTTRSAKASAAQASRASKTTRSTKASAAQASRASKTTRSTKAVAARPTRRPRAVPAQPVPKATSWTDEVVALSPGEVVARFLCWVENSNLSHLDHDVASALHRAYRILEQVESDLED
mgnify:CR=1 FL=1